ncbi:MAG: hypothetical protein JJ895_10555 [Balneolaceae bacterium]|nr:hypothetical protein [Balneolaceae bacterium]
MESRSELLMHHYKCNPMTILYQDSISGFYIRILYQDSISLPFVRINANTFWVGLKMAT